MLSMKRPLLLPILLCLAVSCGTPANKTAVNNVPLDDTITSNRGIYYWKTVFSLNDHEKDFLERHQITKLYLKLFDVAFQETSETRDTLSLVSIATTRFESPVPENIEVIPTVYITFESISYLNSVDYHDIKSYADRILTRVESMVSFHGLPGVKEVQFDCDWTSSTFWTYHYLCEEAKRQLNEKGMKLSITLRLHQMDDDMNIPADRGVLMLYNTGSFKNVKETNSILTYEDAEPYIRQHDIPYPVDYAYPTYSWSLLYRDNEFKCIVRNIDPGDTTIFEKTDYNKFRVRSDTTIGDVDFRKGDIIRHEESEFKEIERVKSDLTRRHDMKGSRQIIYHLDSTNLSKYTDDEIKYMFIAY